MADEKQKKKIGRPTKFSETLAKTICERISNGESTITICEEPEMPAKSVLFRWLDSNEAFRDQYARAKRDLAHVWAEETVKIADRAVPIDGRVDKQKLQVDARKWIVSKLLPKVYSEKHISEITGKDGGPLKTEMSIGLKELHEMVMAKKDRLNGSGSGDK